MTSKLFFQNLNYDTSEDDIQELFGKCGSVLNIELKVGARGFSRGLGTVEMGSVSEAEKVIAEYDGVEYMGRKIHIRHDDPERAGGRRYNRGGYERRDYGRRDDNRRDDNREYGRRDDTRRQPRAPRARPERYQSPTPIEGRRLFVRNMSFDATDEDIKEHFEAAGPVEYVDIFRRARGISMGYGTVLMETKEGALRAVEELHGVEHLDRELKVEVDKKLD